MSAPLTTQHNVLVIEDTAVSRTGLSAELRAAGFDVAAVPDQAGCQSQLTARRPDVVVCDLYLDGESGAPAFPLIGQLVAEDLRVVVYSTWALDPDILTLLDLGIQAYLQKSNDIASLISVLRAAVSIPATSPPLLTPEVAGALKRRQRFGLTPAEVEVLTYVSQHLTNAEIAALRVVSEDTIKTQLASIRAKLGAQNRSAAVRSAHRYGLIGRWHRSTDA